MFSFLLIHHKSFFLKTQALVYLDIIHIILILKRLVNDIYLYRNIFLMKIHHVTNTKVFNILKMYVYTLLFFFPINLLSYNFSWLQIRKVMHFEVLTLYHRLIMLHYQNRMKMMKFIVLINQKCLSKFR